jgi:hypothetical protein
MSESDQHETTSQSNTGEDPQETTPTGDAPELNIQVGVENGKVVILFSQRLSTVGLPPDSARKMAEALILHANQVEELKT